MKHSARRRALIVARKLATLPSAVVAAVACARATQDPAPQAAPQAAAGESDRATAQRPATGGGAKGVAPAVLPPDLSISATVEFARHDRDVVWSLAHVTNAGRDTARLEVGGCPLITRAYRGEPGIDAPAWSSTSIGVPSGDSAARRAARRSVRQTSRACPAVRRHLRIAPGATWTLQDGFRVSRMAKAGFGPYTFTVAVRFVTPSLTTPEYPAGELVLP